MNKRTIITVTDVQRALDMLEANVRTLVIDFTKRTGCTVKVSADAWVGIDDVMHATMVHCGLSHSSGSQPCELCGRGEKR